SSARKGTLGKESMIRKLYRPGRFRPVLLSSLRPALTKGILTTGLLFVLMGCHRGGPRVVAVVPKGHGSIFWETVHAGALAAGKKFGVAVLWNGPAMETEISKQISIIEDFTNRRVDGLVIAPTDSKALVPVIESAIAKGIPVTIFDSGAETENYLSFVATDNYQGGVMAAHRLGQILNKNGKVAIVAVIPGSASTTQREEGFKDTLQQQYPNLKVVAFQYGMSDRAKSLAVTEDILTGNPDLDGIFASNEASALGASQAVKLRGLANKVKIVGFDSSPSLISDIEEGIIDSLVVQNPFVMGYEGVRTICEKLDGKTPLHRIDTGVTMVTKENLSDPKIHQLLNPDLKN
ncbi:MAG: ABC transporter substrate-binding protein, partial [Terriglobia bacterium]